MYERPKGRLEDVLAAALAAPDDRVAEILGNLRYRRLRTARQAERVGRLLSRLPVPSKDPEKNPAHQIISWAGGSLCKAADKVLRRYTGELAPLHARMTDWLDAHPMPRNANHEQETVFLLKIISYRCPDEAGWARLIASRHHPILEDGFLWPNMLHMIAEEADHVWRHRIYETFREDLPGQVCGIGFMEYCTLLLEQGVVDRHPYDSKDGRARLEAVLRDPDDRWVWKYLAATRCLPWVGARARKPLLELAAGHRHLEVRMRAAWAAAKSGDRAGLDRLLAWGSEPNTGPAARKLLESLDALDQLPESVRTKEFDVLAAASEAVQAGYPLSVVPDVLEIVDHRVLYWPPTCDRRPLWLVRYAGPTRRRATDVPSVIDEPDVPRKEGIALIGSLKPGVLREPSAHLSALEAYGLHVCWELLYNRDGLTPHRRTPESGIALLAMENAEFRREHRRRQREAEKQSQRALARLGLRH
jgi:hypothetical protein